MAGDTWRHSASTSGLLSLSIEPAKSSIAPFRGLKRPLQFLGLFETSLCRLTHIPAYKVRGQGTLAGTPGKG